MAISRRFPIPFDLAFPLGAYLVSEVSPVFDFEKSTRENKVQQVDIETGKLLWQVDVLDADPEAKRSSKTVSVKIPGNVQPVPPGNDGSSPFTPVEFEGLTVLPWIESSENFSKISWSFRATEVVSPAKKLAPVSLEDGKSASAVAAKSSAA
jgi:hypothetical protein